MREIDLTLEPAPEAGAKMLLVPQLLHIYESSVEGMTTVVMRDPRAPRYMTAGTRLTCEQVRELADELSKYAYGETLPQSYERGYEAGYESGFDRGYCEVDL